MKIEFPLKPLISLVIEGFKENSKRELLSQTEIIFPAQLTFKKISSLSELYAQGYINATFKIKLIKFLFDIVI
jgi:hypothetical protein